MRQVTAGNIAIDASDATNDDQDPSRCASLHWEEDINFLRGRLAEETVKQHSLT
jgi:hypothetical protein